MPTPQTEAPAEPIRFTTNVIVPSPDAPGGSRFIEAGQPSPYHDISEVPINLRSVVATEDDADDSPNLPRGNFQLGELYELTDDNRLGRQLKSRVRRQVQALEASAEEQEALEEEASRELPEEIAQDLEAAHQDSVAFQIAEASARARRADAVTDSIIAEQEPPTLYVKRPGRHYIAIDKARLRPAEHVFIRSPDGYRSVGICDSEAQPPDAPLNL